MVKVGKTDVFERKYIQEFRQFAGGFGEFVSYERDRGARDIGLHLTRKAGSGAEQLTSALCWFQMKGIMAGTLSKGAFDKLEHLSVSLSVQHLKFWFLQPVPTYLVVYVESVNRFLVLNIQDYVAQQWGNKILTFAQKTMSARVPKQSLLDEQAFELILRKSDIQEWMKALATSEESARFCQRDYDLIWHFGTAKKRGKEHRIEFWDWQSKTRGQFQIQERSIDELGEWETLREHWQYMMNFSELQEAYPYLELFALDSESYWDEDDRGPCIELANGDVVVGTDAAGEYYEYVVGVRLNEIGEQLFNSVELLTRLGLVTITPGKQQLVSVAPWNDRAV